MFLALFLAGLPRVWSFSIQEKRVFMDNASVPKTARSGFHYPRYDARMHDGDEVQLETIHSTWLSLSHDPPLTLRGRTMALKAANGKFCAMVRGDPECRIKCDQDDLPFHAWLEVSKEPINVDKVSLRGLRGGKYCVDQPEGVKCDSHRVSGWEVFGIADAGGGKIGLKGGRKGHFCADTGHGLVCDQKDLGGAAIFQPVTDTPLAAGIVHTKDPNAAATFVVHRKDLDSPSVALLCKEDGHYLAADKTTGALSCSSSEPWTILYARVTWWDVKTATFRSPDSGLYFKAGAPKSPTDVAASNKDGTGWALWKVQLTGGYEPLRPLVRGVNLGNWFLLERWMSADLFYDETGERAFEDQCDAIDEYGLMHALGPKVARKRMEHHWSSWITENDIEWLANHGINTVRVPFGYWMVLPTPPFIEGQLKYLDALFEWCERHHVYVLLDFHGLKGSQTGNPTSGNCGACGHSQCGDTHVGFLEEQATNLEVIDRLTTRYSRSPVYYGFAVANEVSSAVSSQETMAFYEKAYNIIRRKNRDALVVLFATFNPSTYPFPNFRNAVEDIHIYFGMGFGHPSLDQQENLQRARKAVAGLHWHVLVGEWSLGANGHPTLSWEPSQRDAFFASFAKMQLQAWETHSIGWIYWSYKTRFPNSTWNFRDMCNVGWLPGCTKSLTYAPAEWWEAPACAYAYLDGGCPEPQSGVGWWLVPLGLVLAVGAAGAAIAFLRPSWAVQFLTTAGAAAGVAVGSAGKAVTAAAAATSASLPQLNGWQLLALGRGEANGDAGTYSPRLAMCDRAAAPGTPGHARADMMEQPFIW